MTEQMRAHAAPQAAAATEDTLRLFDGLAPFFLNHPAGSINWSKIPFRHLERDGALDPVAVEAVVAEVEAHVRQMAGLGYNAVALDDLAHLVAHDFYPESLKRKLASYRALYERVFGVVKAVGLRLFVITDYMFFNPAIDTYLSRGRRSAVHLFAETVEAALAGFPEIDGIVLRIGESDGVDVDADFKSRLTIRRPREARALLDRLLPMLEARGKTLVFRTWTLGADQVGDLIWNRITYDAIFGEVASPNLIVSLKYGDSDFFRYLELNPLFFHGPQRKIVELQCRREYEGMGEFPSFVGWLYARYLATLRAGGSNLAGIYAIQAGGWAPFSRLAFCSNRSIWNELNAFVTVRLFMEDATVEATVADFCRRQGIGDVALFLRFLALADEAIEDGLYVREFAERSLYFRRVRIPPLIWVFWHTVTAGGLVGMLHRHLVRDKAAAVAAGYRAVETVREMLEIAQRLDLPDRGIRFQRDTFEILAHLREVLLGVDTAETRTQLDGLLAAYRRTYPAGYVVDYAPTDGGSAWSAAWLFRLLIRHEKPYRRTDRVLLNRHVTRLKAAAARRLQPSLPRFVNKQGMPAEVLLR